MVPLPLFKLAALFVRQISKYGANSIKVQAHDHPKFRVIATRYGQKMHQLNMRMQVALLRDVAAERRAKERAEAPTAKTQEDTRREAHSKGAGNNKSAASDTSKNVWRRKFRPLPESKAVDLFADVIGDTFVLVVAASLILYEYIRTKGKPDANAEKIEQLHTRIEELAEKEKQLQETERERQARVESLEQALAELRKTGSKKMALQPA